MKNMSFRWMSTGSLCLCLCGLLVQPIGAQTAQPIAGRKGTTAPAIIETMPDAHPEFLLIGYHRHIKQSQRDNRHTAAGTRLVRSFRRIPLDVVRVPDRKRMNQTAELYRQDPHVAYVEPNYRLQKTAIPNDPRFNELWGLLNTGQDSGTPGADINITNVWATLGTGSTNIIVAVIDTGIDYNHPDLAANMWVNPDETANGEDSDGNGIIDDIHGARWTTGNGSVTSGDPMDGDGHGTHVAGTIGAVGNNATGVVGVCWKVRLMALKFLDDSGSGYTADAIAAIEYAIDKGAHLSNNSWGGGGYSQALKDAIDAAADAGQLFIAAAGNDGTDNDTSPHYPSNYDCSNILSVASSDRNDQPSWFSNYGRESVHLAAPGSAILSTVNGNAYESYDGTSMAAPHVAGAAALLLSLHPNASLENLKSWLLNGIAPLSTWSQLTQTGGRLNVDESARLAALPEFVTPVEGFTATSEFLDTSIFLAWTNPPGANFSHVTIRRDPTNFPGRIDTGTLLYEGGAEAFEDTAVEIGQRYFYTAWAIHTNDAGDHVSAARLDRARAGGDPDDWFTQIFADANIDLTYTTVTLVPDDSLNGYKAYADPAEDFPTDPAGSTNLPLGDDTYEKVILAEGKSVLLYGIAYTSLFAGANGFLTFDSGDTTYTESLAAHFNQPRVSGLFRDFDPSAGGSVSWTQLTDRVAFTYQNLPEWSQPGSSSFQIELFFDGKIRLTWLGLSARRGLVGLSKGGGIPDGFIASNFSEYPSIDPLRILPNSGAEFTGTTGGPFKPSEFVYTIQNAGTNLLNWTLSTTASWVNIHPDYGTLAPDEQTNVVLTLTAEAGNLPHGVYSKMLAFSNTVSGRIHFRNVTLSVTREDMSALLYVDYLQGENFVRPALQRAGYALTEVAAWQEFNTLLHSNQYSMIFMLNQSSAMEADRDAVDHHLDAGGMAVLADWTQDNLLAAAFDGSYTFRTDQSPVAISNSVLSQGVSNPMPIADPGWGTLWSMGLSTIYDGDAAAFFPGGDAAIVRGNQGRSALLGFLADTPPDNDGPVFFDNLLLLLETGGDAMRLMPRTGFAASGYQHGPFLPTETVFTLSNHGTNDLVWSASISGEWLDLDHTAGVLAAGLSSNLTVSLNAGAVLLDPGLYPGALLLSNTASGVSVEREISLNVIPLPGEIQIFDSVAPTNDLLIPFGNLFVGQQRSEQVTIYNADTEHDLVVTGITLLNGNPEDLTGHGTSAKGAGAAEHAAAQYPRPRVNGVDIKGDVDDLWVEGTLLVGFRPASELAVRDEIHASLGAQRLHRYRRIAVDVVALPPDANLKEWMDRYKAEDAIAYAEPNYRVWPQLEPDDPRFHEQWALRNTGQSGGTPGADIRALEAWNTTTGSSNIIVAVIDTGVDYNHPDLAANMWINPTPTFGDLHGARWTSGNGIPTNGDPMDGNSHGTHVAGTIGAVGSNGIGIAGVCWNVRIMALKFLPDSGGGATADAIAAIEYAIDKGAHLSNNSWGGGSYSQALEDIIAAAGEAGQLFIAAAGNNGANNDVTAFYPAGYNLPNVISVANSTRNDVRAGNSNYGVTKVHLAAPGSEILSTVPSGGYGLKSGTSMAAPHVAGVAALLLSMNPWATPSLIKQAIMAGVDVLPAWTGLTITAGRLNAAGALQALNPHFNLNLNTTLPLILRPGESWAFAVDYAPVSAGSHTGGVRIVSNDTNAPMVDVLLTGAAEYDALELYPETAIPITGDIGGPFTPHSIGYTLTNTGPAELEWSTRVDAEWLDIAPTAGSLAAGMATGVTVTVNSDAEALAVGSYIAIMTVSNRTSGVAGSRVIDLTVRLPLCEALDACDLVWTTGGNSEWFGQTNTTFDGVDAAQSGALTHNQESWLETEVAGPGDLSFRWKVSSENNYDWLEFYINGSQQDRISGNIDWQSKTYELAAGTSTLRWRYVKDGSISDGSDCGWVDQVILSNPQADSDADGMPDWWELEHFGSSTSAPPTLLRRDGLEVPTYHVYLWGVDPADSNAVFEIVNIMQSTSGPSNRIQFAFSSVTNRIYDVLTHTNLFHAEGWQVLTGYEGQEGTGEPITVEDPSSLPRRYYRIRVRLPE